MLYVYLGQQLFLKSKQSAVLPPGQVNEPFAITWDINKGEEQKLHTLIIYDNDAPYPSPRNENSPFLHFLVLNIPGNEISRGNVIFPYMYPNIPADSPPHNYTISLYEQRGKVSPDAVFVRQRFNIDEFIRNNDLILRDTTNFVVNSRDQAPTPVATSRVPSPASPRVEERVHPMRDAPMSEFVIATPQDVGGYGGPRYEGSRKQQEQEEYGYEGELPRSRGGGPRTQEDDEFTFPDHIVRQRRNGGGPRIRTETPHESEYVGGPYHHEGTYSGGLESRGGGPYQGESKLVSIRREGGSSRKEEPERFSFRDLNRQQEKYCHCVTEVSNKQPEQCLTERAWFERREGKTCTNPYAVCANVGERTQKCGEHIVLERLTDRQLRTWANLHNIPIGDPFVREDLIRRIEEKKGRENPSQRPTSPPARVRRAQEESRRPVQRITREEIPPSSQQRVAGSSRTPVRRTTTTTPMPPQRVTRTPIRRTTTGAGAYME